jgi:hypothetical protein
MKTSYRPIFIIFQVQLLLGTLLFTAVASAANMSAEVSRNPVSIDESFELIIMAEGEVDGEPDFSPLEHDFQILQRSQNQSIQMINGQFSRNLRWVLTLMAKRSGILQIPAIVLGQDQSQPIKIRVAAPSPDTNKNESDIFLEVSLEPETAYVQQQLLYRVRLFRAINITDASLSEPSVSDQDAIIEQLGDEQSYETKRHGRRYLVNEINYAIFPQNSGNLRIDPLVFQGRIVQRRHNRGFRSPMDMFEQAGPLKRWRTEEQTAVIKPLPNIQGKTWLPAMGVQLKESWPEGEPQFKVGEPITRTLTLQALGLSGAQLPRVDAGIPDNFKQYPDQANVEEQKTANGIIGIREEKIAIIPTKAGNYLLPAVELPWWNTQTDRMEIARIPERSIQVLANPDSATDTSKSTVETTTEKYVVPKPKATQKEQTSKITTSEIDGDGGSSAYQWLSLSLAIGWLLTIGFWFVQHRRRPMSLTATQQETTANQESVRQAFAKLKQAATTRDTQATKDALLAWGSVTWPHAPPRSLGAIAARLTDEAATEITKLERTLYGRNGSGWDAVALLNALKGYQARGSKQTTIEGSLQELYPE